MSDNYMYMDQGGMILFPKESNQVKKAQLEEGLGDSNEAANLLADFYSVVLEAAFARGENNREELNMALAKQERIEDQVKAFLDRKGIEYSDPYTPDTEEETVIEDSLDPHIEQLARPGVEEYPKDIS